MLIVAGNKVINYDNIVEMAVVRSYTQDYCYMISAYDITEESNILGEYDNEEQAQIELSKFINSYKEEKRIHRFEGE